MSFSIAPSRGLSTGVALCLVSIFCIQLGSALSAGLIREIGPATAAFLRFFVAAVVLALVVRPRFLAFDSRQWTAAVGLGIAMAGMTFCFFSAIERIPLGLAVAIDFLGPLAVAAFGLGGWRLVWPAAAFIGVLFLSHDGTGWVGEPLGMLFAAGAGTGWAAYIILMKRSSVLFQGLDGLAASLLVAALASAPFGILSARSGLSVDMFGAIVGIAFLVPLLPYAMELTALRRMPVVAFGILMSLEPAAASLVGAAMLDQPLALLQIVGTALVVVACVGVTRSGRLGDAA